MDSLAHYMATKELTDPNSQYYIGQPSAIEQIQRYMRGVNTNYFGGKTNLYPGQPTIDKFESTETVRNRRHNESLFKTIIGGAAALFVGLALRKVPGVTRLYKLAWGAAKLPFKLASGILKLGWKAIR